MIRRGYDVEPVTYKWLQNTIDECLTAFRVPEFKRILLRRSARSAVCF